MSLFPLPWPPFKFPGHNRAQTFYGAFFFTSPEQIFALGLPLESVSGLAEEFYTPLHPLDIFVLYIMIFFIHYIFFT